MSSDLQNAAPGHPKPPVGLKRQGKALWVRLCAEIEFEPQELLLLTEIVRTVDLLDALDAKVRREGLFTSDGRVLPAVVEARLQRVALARLLASLRLPDTLADLDSRPQRRGASRGVYAFPREQTG